MDIGSLLLGLALLLVVVAIVIRPLVNPPASTERELSTLDRHLAERERLLANLRDLDFDHATGKIIDDDYRSQRTQLVADGVAVLKQLDAIGAGRPAANGHAPNRADDEIERAVARLRSPASTSAPAVRPTAEPACAECGRLARPGDRFCGGCGTPFSAPHEAKAER